MNSKDFIVREIEKIAAIVSHLIGLKEAGKADEFMNLADSTVLIEFNIHLGELLELPLDDFNYLIQNNNYSADKLDALAQLLYLTHDLYDVNSHTLSALNKVIGIFDILETKFHRQSFDNIQKRKIISTLLTQS
jgi:hypothetical protein